MSKLRKKFITVLAVLLCAITTLSVALIIPENERKVAEAASNTLNSAIANNFNVLEDDIWISDPINGGKFSYENLQKLYAALTGNSEATFNTVSALGVKNSAYFRGLKANDGKNLSVKFHDYHWTVAGLDRTRKGEVILTLWFTDYTELDTAYQSVQFAEYSVSDTIDAGEWPSNIYSSSVLRTQGLNIGGYYFKTVNVNNKDSTTYTSVGQEKNHPLAPFTMKKTDYPDSVIQYLATPAEVEYQEKGSLDKTVRGGTCVYPNEGYGYYTPQELDGWWPKSGRAHNDYTFLTFTDYSGSTTVKYESWKNDYIWVPSESEIGFNNTYGGIWGLDLNGKTSGYDDSDANAWLRTGGTGTQNGRQLMCKNPGNGLYNRGDCMGAATTDNLKIRPALHLNLTQAAFKTGGISFGNKDTTVSTLTDGSKKATATHDYDGKDYTLTLPEYDKLDVDDSTLPNTAQYDKDSGEFTVKFPNSSDNDNYEITVTPSQDYYWADAATVEEGKKPRTYAIHINKATIEKPDWKDFSVQYGGSLLQANQQIESKTVKDIAVDFEIKYCITHAASGTPQEPSAKDWKSAAELATTASDTGKYRIDYKICDVDGNHTELYGSYIVTVISDTVTISLKGDGLIGSSEYGAAAANLTNQTWLNQQFAQRVTLSGTSGSYDGESSVLEFLNKESLNVVLLKDGASGKVPATANGYDRFDVGTYYLGLSESSSIGFEWDTDGVAKYPSYEINKKEIKVYIVDGSGGNDLTHIYGNGLPALNYDVDDDVKDFLAEINDKFPRMFTITDIIKCDIAFDDYTLSNKTPVGTFMIEGSTGTNGNFDVNFDDAEYVVTKRPVRLQVSSVEVKYGTDLGSYKFTLTDADKSLPAWDKASALKAEYYLTKNDGVTVDFKDVAIGDYVLCVRVDNPNYDFTYDNGTLKVVQADFDMKEAELKNAAYVYNGEPHPAQLSGALPSEEIKVTFRYVNMADGSTSEDAPVEVGLYTVYASFTHGNPNYNVISDQAAYIRIVGSADELNQDFPNLPTPDEIAAAAEQAKKEAQERAELESKKSAAKEELDKAAQAKKDAIDNNPDLTDEEKAAAKAEVDKQLEEGKKAIDSATDVGSVESVESSTKANIENIKPEHKGSFPWWIIAVAAVLIIVAVVAIIVVKKRQTADGDDFDEYDDDYDFDDEEYEEDFDDEI